MGERNASAELGEGASESNEAGGVQVEGRPDRNRLALIAAVAGALAGTFDLRRSLGAVVEILGNAPQIDCGVLVVSGLEEGEMHFQAGSFVRSDIDRAGLRMVQDVASRASRRVETIAVTSVDSGLTSGLEVGGRGGRGMIIGAPVLVEGVPTGALSVHMREDAGDDGDGSEELVRALAALVAGAVGARRLAEEERRRLLEENEALRAELGGRHLFPSVLGNTSAMRRVHAQIVQASRTSSAVLIRGEAGAGKKLIAEAIHHNSPRTNRPLVTFDCSGTPIAAAGAELFGDRRAGSAAAAMMPASLTRAEGGTLIIEEIGALERSLQARLFAFIQRYPAYPSLATGRTGDVRIIATTRMDLEAGLRDGSFNLSLYRWLQSFSIRVPPLRDRGADIVLLADHFARKYAAEFGISFRRISAPAIDILASHDWPGNVRELEDTTMAAVLACDGGVIQGHHLPFAVRKAERPDRASGESLTSLVAAYERGLIEDALRATRGNRAQASQLLQTTDRILGYRVRRYGIDPRQFRASS